jgi:transcriptional regulator with XRE-family HTH domain
MLDDPKLPHAQIVKARKKQGRAQFQEFRKKLRLKQEQLAALVGVSPEKIARFERGKHLSQDTNTRIVTAILKTIAKKNPEAMRQAARRAVLGWAEKCDRVLSVEPESDLALELERLNGKSLAELKAQAEKLSPLFRNAAKGALSLIE